MQELIIVVNALFLVTCLLLGIYAILRGINTAWRKSGWYLILSVLDITAGLMLIDSVIKLLNQ